MLDAEAIDALIEYLRLSGNIRDLQRSLADAESPSGRSWDEIKVALTERADGAGDVALVETAWDAILWGRKTLRLYELPAAARQAARQYDPPAYTLGANLDAVHPKDGDGAQPVLAHVRRSDTTLTLMYRSTRMVARKTKISEDWLDAKFRPILRMGDEAYIVSRHPALAYDCVEIPLESGFASLKISTDFTDHTLVADPEDINANLLSQVRRDIGDDCIWNAVDLFDAIGSMYQDNAEGRIVELQFECTTGATRVERMRRSDTDLRQEAYHRAGVQATDIHPFYAGVRWPDVPDTELVLPGTRRMLSLTAGNRLFEAIVRARRSDDYSHAVQRLLAHLAPTGAPSNAGDA